MTVTQYVGARYVPLFADPIEWSKDTAYEPLTIVIHEGNSYTSRQAVPKGIDIANDEFWALTSNYNAQVESYRKETTKAVEDASNALSLAQTNEQDIATLDSEMAGTADSGLKSLIERRIVYYDDFRNVPQLYDGSIVYIMKTYSLYIVDSTATVNGYNIVSAGDNVIKLIADDEVNITQLITSETSDYADVIQFALNNYSVVNIPAGTFAIGKQLEIPANTTLSGIKHKTIFKCFDSGFAKIAGRYSNVKNLIIYGADSATSTVSTYNGIEFDNTANNFNLKLNDIWLQQFNNGLYNNGGTIWNSELTNVETVKCSIGVNFQGATSFNNTYINLFTNNCVKSMNINNERGSSFIDCNFATQSAFPAIVINNSYVNFISCNFEVDTPNTIQGGSFIKINGYSCSMFNCKINFSKISVTDKYLFDISDKTNLANITLNNINASASPISLVEDNISFVTRNLITVLGQNSGITYGIPSHKNSEVMYSLPNIPIRYWSAEADSNLAISAIKNNGNGTIAYDKSTNKIQYVKNGVLTDF